MRRPSSRLAAPAARAPALPARRPGLAARIGALALLSVLAVLAALPAAAPARDFPRSFQWGTAISGFQSEMGRGRDLDRRSDWWRWTHDATNAQRGWITADRPERGPGFLARYREDVDRAARELNLNAFRLGLEWSRIFPRSTRGARTLRQLDRVADRRAVSRYRSILRRIRDRGMEPWVTLHHFVLPAWLHDPIATRDAFAAVGLDGPPPTGLRRAGWLDRATIAEFRKYAGYVAWKLGPEVDRWITINEPMVQAVNGYANIPGVQEGYFPPGAANFQSTLQVVQNMADASAGAYDAVKARDRGSRVGVVHNMIAFTPADPASDADRRGTGHADYLFNRLFLDAAIRGLRDRNADGVIQPGERNPRLARKADFVGLNYYFRGRVTGLDAPLTPSVPILDFVPATIYAHPENPDAPPCPTRCTDFGWEIYPEGFRAVLNTAGAYGRPVYVTENGISDAQDDTRPDYLRSHLRAMHEALREDRVPVRGYFHWTLVDNFEWAHGYTQRFGLYRYDPRTLRRSPRPSARLFARVARTGELP